MKKLKNEINKSATMRELRKEAEKGYERSWQPELQVEAFMKGAESLLNLLHLPHVSNRRELYFAFMKEYNAIMGEGEYQILKEEVEVLLAKYSC